MLVSVFLALFLPCVGTSAVFIVYICLLWYATSYHTNNNNNVSRSPKKPVPKNGLSASELEKLPKVSAKELVLGTECAVCLDEIENGQPARLIPGCNHGFHLECADTWLSNHLVCPICRTKLDPEFFSNADQNPC
ncbi:43kDa postsynaptic protein [Fagus crenata]|jgi:E3 ubiquitin-protein ligase ATL23|uniref:RING-type domain-containing protein n=1 Tax=Fagus sylvatica TaxID=28930 RepID=A0A2N9IUR9_FAGSY